MEDKIIPLSYKDREKDSLLINGVNIPIPIYVKRSVKLYRYIVVDGDIFLQRKCNKCKEFFSVQNYTDDKLLNLQSSNFKFKGEKSGFNTICNSCSNLYTIDNNISTYNDTDDMVQLNITINSALKKYYKILSINNGTSLKSELTNALINYRKISENKN